MRLSTIKTTVSLAEALDSTTANANEPTPDEIQACFYGEWAPCSTCRRLSQPSCPASRVTERSPANAKSPYSWPISCTKTKGLKHREEEGGLGKKDNYRGVWGPNPVTDIPADKSYHGRGPMQLSHPQNYADASVAIFNNSKTLLHNPDRVRDDKQTGWETAAWYWGNRVGTQPNVKAGHFGASVKAINPALECEGKGVEQVANRKKAYTTIFEKWHLEGQPDFQGC